MKPLFICTLDEGEAERNTNDQISQQTYEIKRRFHGKSVTRREVPSGWKILRRPEEKMSFYLTFSTLKDDHPHNSLSYLPPTLNSFYQICDQLFSMLCESQESKNCHINRQFHQLSAPLYNFHSFVEFNAQTHFQISETLNLLDPASSEPQIKKWRFILSESYNVLQFWINESKNYSELKFESKSNLHTVFFSNLLSEDDKILDCLTLSDVLNLESTCSQLNTDIRHTDFYCNRAQSMWKEDLICQSIYLIHHQISRLEGVQMYPTLEDISDYCSYNIWKKFCFYYQHWLRYYKELPVIHFKNFDFQKSELEFKEKFEKFEIENNVCSEIFKNKPVLTIEYDDGVSELLCFDRGAKYIVKNSKCATISPKYMKSHRSNKIKGSKKKKDKLKYFGL